jgi:predicted MPP superfamily phosphohydrolase
MLRMLVISIALVSLGEALSLQWALLAFGDADPSLTGGLGALVAFAAFNSLVFPFVRSRLRAGGLAQWFSRSWILVSVAALFTGILLTLVFALVGGGGSMLGMERESRVVLVWLGGSVVVLGFGSVAWGASVGDRRIRVDRVPLPLRGAAESHRALRIVHISDLHIGPLLPAARLSRFVDRINHLTPDLTVISGDLFDFDPDYVDAGCRELARLEGRLGVFAVTGNHDVYTGSELVAAGLARHTRIRLLRDSWERIDVDGAPLAIAGIDDPGDRWTERESEHPVLERLAREIPKELPTLLLAHRPSYFGHAARLGFSLVLSGHTHGGQVALPRAHHVNVSRMISNRTRGVFRSGDATLYVNRGLGMAGLPLRLNCPREIALIELVEPAQTAG